MADGFSPGYSLRLPPSNLAAEAAVLGALLSNNRVREQCSDLRPQCFADPEYARVFMAAIDGIDAGQRVDAVSLRGHFSPDLLASLLAATISHQVSHLLIDIAESLSSQAYGGHGAAEMALAAAGQIDGLLAGAGAAASGVTLGQAVDRAAAAITEARERQGPAGHLTGFPKLDERLGGLETGTLTVLAGRPGMGKSALGWQIAVNLARAGTGVLAISLEMSALELGRRALATAARVPITAMKYGRVTVDEASRIPPVQRELRDLPLRIEEAAGQTAVMIAARARAMRRTGLGLVLIDHLHIVRPDDADTKAGPTWAVGRISGAMKRLAKDCGCAVLLLAQLNRGVEGREDKRPGLADLRQAGDIEQDADAVGFVYRPEYYLGPKPEKTPGEVDAKYAARAGAWLAKKELCGGKAEIIWPKVRDGAPGTDTLYFHGPTTSFSEEP